MLLAQLLKQLLTIAAIVEVVYADVPREVWPAAELTVKAQLTYLGIAETT